MPWCYEGGGAPQGSKWLAIVQQFCVSSFRVDNNQQEAGWGGWVGGGE